MIRNYAELAKKYMVEFESRSNGYSLPEIQFVSEWKNHNYGPLPQITISLPVCNQERLISHTLKSLVTNLEIPAQLILILDNCTDGTSASVDRAVKELQLDQSKVSNLLIFQTENDIFEASCDNFALSLSNTEYFLTIQADNFLNDRNFVSRAISCFENHCDLGGISARGVVPFDHPRLFPHRNSKFRQLINAPSKFMPRVFKNTFLGPFNSKLAFFGDVSTPPRSHMRFSVKEKRHLFIGEAVVRGPILWRTKPLKDIGGFNDVAYFLGWDDYDVAYRLLCNEGLRVAYLPSSCFSLINTGTNSYPRSSETQKEYKNREILASAFEGGISNYWSERTAGRSSEVFIWEKRPIYVEGKVNG